MASPTADSDAAMVNMNKEKICPYKSSKYNENKIKFKFNDNRINSIPINTIKKFRKFNIIPIKQIIKIEKVIVRIVIS